MLSRFLFPVKSNRILGSDCHLPFGGLTNPLLRGGASNEGVHHRCPWWKDQEARDRTRTRGRYMIKDCRSFARRSWLRRVNNCFSAVSDSKIPTFRIQSRPSSPVQRAGPERECGRISRTPSKIARTPASHVQQAKCRSALKAHQSGHCTPPVASLCCPGIVFQTKRQAPACPARRRAFALEPSRSR